MLCVGVGSRGIVGLVSPERQRAVRDGAHRPGRVAVVAETDRLGRCAVDGIAGLGMHEVVAVLAVGRADAVDAADAVVLCVERFKGRQVGIVRRLKQRAPTVPVVVVAGSIRRPALADGLSAGMDACVLERDVDVCLALAIEGARRGQVSLPRELATTVARPVLSVREKQILALVVMGFSNSEIAQKLFISESTVKSHLSSAFDRLGVRSRHQAAAMILDPESGLGPGILTISGDERRRGPA